MMGQFLVELHKTFPEEKALRRWWLHSIYWSLQTTPRRGCFHECVTPYADRISVKDESFLLKEIDTIDFLKDLNIKSYWVKMSESTKGATWQYLQTLYMLGTTITSIPDDTLKMIESIAKQCAEKMETEGGELDQDAIMKMMGSMLGGLPKK